jgi:hypothetical protein
LPDPIWEKTFAKGLVGAANSVGPEFKPQYPTHKKKKNFRGAWLMVKNLLNMHKTLGSVPSSLERAIAKI